MGAAARSPCREGAHLSLDLDRSPAETEVSADQANPQRWKFRDNIAPEPDIIQHCQSLPRSPAIKLTATRIPPWT